MQPISENAAVQKAQTIRPLSEINERECLARLASEVPAGGRIVEIGCLYGGTTGVLALANPYAEVIAIDDFSWHPPDDIPTSAQLVRENMKSIGAENVSILEGDSSEIGASWSDPIDLLFVDGGHTFDIAFSDLIKIGLHAKVIAVHDYENRYWLGVKEAVTRFREEHAESCQLIGAHVRGVPRQDADHVAERLADVHPRAVDRVLADVLVVHRAAHLDVAGAPGRHGAGVGRDRPGLHGADTAAPHLCTSGGLARAVGLRCPGPRRHCDGVARAEGATDIRAPGLDGTVVRRPHGGAAATPGLGAARAVPSGIPLSARCSAETT